MNYRFKVSVLDSSSKYIDKVDGQQAEQLVKDGASTVSIRGANEEVYVIMLAANQKLRGMRDRLRPGSFGIRREIVAGHTVYSHRGTWDKQLNR